MNEETNRHSPVWVNFIGGSFASSVLLLGVGIYHLPVDLWTKGYLGMGTVLLVQTAISLTKTIRDNEEFKKLNRKADEPKPEKLFAQNADH